MTGTLLVCIARAPVPTDQHAPAPASVCHNKGGSEYLSTGLSRGKKKRDGLSDAKAPLLPQPATQPTDRPGRSPDHQLCTTSHITNRKTLPKLCHEFKTESEATVLNPCSTDWPPAHRHAYKYRSVQLNTSG